MYDNGVQIRKQTTVNLRNVLLLEQSKLPWRELCIVCGRYVGLL